MKLLAAFEIPGPFKKPCAALIALVETNPGKLVYQQSAKDAQGKKQGTRKLTGVMNPFMLFVQDKAGAKGMCGVYPLVQWLKAKTVVLKLDSKEITYNDLARPQR